MLALVRTAIRFFSIGFVTGVLLAPRAGSDTRALIREKLLALADSVREIAALPPDEGGSARSDRGAQRDGAVQGRRGRARQAEGSGAGAQS